METNSEIINDYVVIKKIGKGGFGTVKLVESIEKKLKYALKIIEVQPQQKQDALKEARMYVELGYKHPNLLKAPEGYFLFNKQQYLVIVLEYCPEGSLVNFIGKFNDEKCVSIIEQITSGLAFLHQNKIVHRDIKPENILMLNGVPKIGDFGLSRIIESSGAQTRAGTSEYMAPQLFQEEKHDNKVDIWALGIVCLELLSGVRITELWNCKGNRFLALRKDFPSEEILKKIKCEKMRDLVGRMIQKEASDRPSAGEILEYLKKSNLTKSQLNGEGSNSIQSLKQSQYNPNLKVDPRNEIRDLDTEKFVELLNSQICFPNLIEINMFSKSMSAQEIKILALNSHKFKDLRSIQLGRNNIKSEGLITLTEATHEFNKLQALGISSNNIREQGWNAFTESFYKFKNLQALYIGRNELKNEGLTKLIQAANKLPNLKILELSDCWLSDNGAKGLAQFTHNLTNLEVLMLGDNDIKAQGAKALAEAGNKFKNLRILLLGYNKIQDEGLKALAQSADKFQNLQVLDLCSNKIKDAGVKILAENGEKFKNLVSLYLCSNFFKDKCFEDMEKLGQKLEKIKIINLTNNSVSKEWLKKLSESKKGQTDWIEGDGTSRTDKLKIELFKEVYTRNKIHLHHELRSQK